MGPGGRFDFATDADGNVKGGVRLPHMPTVLGNAERAGAPLGVYGGIDTDHREPLNLFAWLGGTFAPFSTQELAARYTNRDDYVHLVSKAAASLLSERFILWEDHDAYLQAARHYR